MENSQNIDMMTLSWCVPEIRDSLHQVAQALDEQLNAPAGSLDAVTRARLHLHQTHGALQVAGVQGVVRITEEVERVLDAYENDTIGCDEHGVMIVKRVLTAIVEYLEDMQQSGIVVPALVLFPYYRDLVQIRRELQPDPTVLFDIDIRSELPAAAREQDAPGAERQEKALQACRVFERALPALIRGEKVEETIATLHDAMKRLQRTQPNPDARLFYWLSFALLDGMKAGALKVDLASRRAVGRINIQNRHLFSTRGDVPEQFIKELLLLIAGAGQGSAVVEEVRRAYNLSMQVPPDYERPRYGLADPEPLQVARQALEQIHRGWEKFASGGGEQELPAFNEGVSLLNRALARTNYTGLAMLAGTLATMPAALSRQQPDAAETLAIEVATAVLFMEEALSGALRSNLSYDDRAQELAARIGQLLAKPESFDPTPLPWLVALSSKANDRVTKTAFVNELKHNLSSCEQALDDYFRDETAVASLEPIMPVLAETASVLKLLDFIDPSRLCQSISAQVLDIFEARVQPGEINRDRLAEGIGSLGFFVDMLLQSNHRAHCFRLDRDRGVLYEDESACSCVHGEAEDGSGPGLMGDGVVISADRAVDASDELGATTDIIALEDGEVELSPEEAELHEIFLMEAAEVLDAIDESLKEARRAPEDREALVTIRRGFHTLKGSARMVGLDAFGEAAWSFEQMLNHWLSDDRDGTTALFDLMRDGAELFRSWTTQLADAPRRVLDASALSARCAAIVNKNGTAPAVAAPAQAGVASGGMLAAAATAASVAAAAVVSHQPAAEAATDEVDTLAAKVAADETVAPIGQADGMLSLDIETLAAVAQREESTEPLDTGTLIIGTDDLPDAEGNLDGKADFSAASWNMLEQQPIELSDNELPTFGGEPCVYGNADATDAVALEAAGAEHEKGAGLSGHYFGQLGKRADDADAGLSLDSFFADAGNAVEAEQEGELAALESVALEAGEQIPVLDAEIGGEEIIMPAPEELASLDAAFVDQTVADEQPTAALDMASHEAQESTVEFPSFSTDDALTLQAVQGEDEEIPLLDIGQTDLSALSAAAPVATPAPDQDVFGASFASPPPALDTFLPASSAIAAEPVIDAGAIAEQQSEAPVAEAVAVQQEVPKVSEAPSKPAAVVPAEVDDKSETQLRIGDRFVDAELFEIFNGEAERARERMQEDWKNWVGSDALRAPETLVRALHTLVGTSRHVGLVQVRAIVTPLEKLLLKQREVAAPLSGSARELIQNALGVVDRMLADFAACREPAADEQTSNAIQSLLENWESGALDAATGTAEKSTAASEKSEVRGENLLKKAAQVLGTARRSAEEKRDPLAGLVNELDADLGPVFFEEAEELMPQVDDNLREWRENPNDGTIPAALMRLFHTLKGSARMAGAMRFGQMIHELETQVEDALAQPPVQVSVIEMVLSGYDRAVSSYEAMLHPELATQCSGQGAGDSDHQMDEEGVSVNLDAVCPQLLAAEKAAQEKARDAAEAATDALVGASIGEDATHDVRPAAVVPEQGASDAAAADAGLHAAMPVVAAAAGTAASNAQHVIRVRADLLDRMVSEAGEVSIARARLDSEMGLIRNALNELTENVNRLRTHLREMEIYADNQIQAKIVSSTEAQTDFDPLEFDRYTRFQEVTKMLAESVNDVSTVQQNAMRALDAAVVDLGQQGQVSRSLQQSLMRVRMVQFSTINDRLYRVVRQSGKDTDKRVTLEIKGGQAEIDRNVLDRMAGPIEHILRNSVAHGIEEREMRAQRGKPEVGELTIEVSQNGNEVIMRFSDDGNGLDLARIEARARERGIIAPDHQPSERELAQLIFAPGFSTAKQVTALSGRGVGMDVVRAEVAGLGGRIDIDTVAGKGSCFTVHLPLSLAVTQVVLLNIDGAKFAVQSALVEQIVQMKPDALSEAYQTQRLDIAGEKVPFYFLGSLLEMDDIKPEAQHLAPVVLLRAGATRIALHVDSVVPNMEVIIKHIGPQLARLSGVAGATVLGNGDIVLILNPVQLAMSRALGSQGKTQTAVFSTSELQGPATIMVVDDSVTVRKVTQRMLAREGYNVMLAKDGVDALRQLQEDVPDLMLVDIEMPRMDGFDLTKNVREHPDYADIPIIMITSRTADKHKNHALSLGVDVFLGKPYDESVLLGHIRSFVSQRAPKVGA
ncbi:MAG: Hpt domain-containing protein [Lautropia sp.]|nr:Hpt domain-containing protein [Lautropia sp.]